MGGWGLFGRAVAVIGKFISIQASRPFLVCFPFHARPNDNRMKASLLSLQQPQKQLGFVFGDGRYKLVSLTFQKTLLLLLILRSILALPALRVILQRCPTDNNPSVFRGSPLCSETLPEFSPNSLTAPMVSIQ